MTAESPSFSDEDLQHKWGREGKSAKIAAVNWCSQNGYDYTTINDKGGWRFTATCVGSVPEGWSRRFTKELAAIEYNGDDNRVSDQFTLTPKKSHISQNIEFPSMSSYNNINKSMLTKCETNTPNQSTTAF